MAMTDGQTAEIIIENDNHIGTFDRKHLDKGEVASYKQCFRFITKVYNNFCYVSIKTKMYVGYNTREN